MPATTAYRLRPPSNSAQSASIAGACTEKGVANGNALLATGADAFDRVDARKIIAGTAANSTHVNRFTVPQGTRELWFYPEAAHTAQPTITSGGTIGVLGRVPERAPATTTNLATPLPHEVNAAFPVIAADNQWLAMPDVDGETDIELDGSTSGADSTDAQKQTTGQPKRVLCLGRTEFMTVIKTPGVVSGGSLMVVVIGCA